MSFLAPFAGLLAGALAMAALVALHALKLRRRPVRVSSTLLWRDAVRDLEVNIPWRRPRLTPMFLLQALAVLLLALAIARPVMGDGGGVPGRLIVVIDASASMSATDGGGEGRTRLDEAKRLAAERLGSLRRASGVPEIAVVRAALDPRMVVAPTRSIEAAIAGVRSVRPTDQPLDADALRTMLGALQDRSGDEEAAGDDPELWVFTDAGMLAARDFPGWTGEVVATNTGAARGDNAGIAALLATRDPTDPELARVFFRLVSNAERPTGVVARIAVGDATDPTPVAIEIPAAGADGPGSVTRTITVPARGSQRIELALDTGGVLVADDRAWVDLPDASPPRTVVFAPEGRADPFLMDVLGVLAPGAVSVHTLAETDALRGAELAVYDRVTPQRLPPIASLGFGSGWPGLDPDAADTGRQRVIAWDRSHPVLRDLSLGPVVFDRAVALPDDAEAGVAVLAEARTGPLIIEAVGGGVRHIRVGFPLTRSNWAVDVGMPIFVAAAFERLAPGVRGEGVVHTTAQAVEVRAAGAVDRVRAIGPDEAEAPVSGEGVAMLGPLERAGVYALEGGEAASVAVSMLDAGESAAAVGESVRFGQAGPGGRRGDVAGDGGGRQELWPWLLLAAFVVMTLEWFIHARRARV